MSFGRFLKSRTVSTVVRHFCIRLVVRKIGAYLRVHLTGVSVTSPWTHTGTCAPTTTTDIPLDPLLLSVKC